MSSAPTNPNAPAPSAASDAWRPDTWRDRLDPQQIVYPDRDAVSRAAGVLASLPPLVTSWEIERLRVHIAQAQRGERFLLQGGDCAEMLADCRPEAITNQLKILLQMSLVLVHGTRKPVVRVARLAGQYAKPRSSKTETRPVDGRDITLPSYFGDLVNRAEFSEAARHPDPMNMVEGYHHAAMTLNFIRSLAEGGFADLHHPEYWDLSFMSAADLPEHLRVQYSESSRELANALRFMEALGEKAVDELTRVEFFTSHEGLNLIYESSQTREVPRREGFYNLTTHLPWIGERTRSLDGAHVEYFRGIRNPVGIKLGPKATSQDAIDLIDALNPSDEEGRIVLIVRMGVEAVKTALRPLVEGVAASGKKVLWVCDPMHGNTIKTDAGIKTRNFDDILEEIIRSIDLHEKLGTRLGGVHFELTGDNVTECVGGAAGVTEDGLGDRYVTECDPRLNYQQALELAFLLARHVR
ncbi:MAG: 3-deoxy-7-phosphoheptulonate synthase class II [Planctomycetota bacterium]